MTHTSEFKKHVSEINDTLHDAERDYPDVSRDELVWDMVMGYIDAWVEGGRNSMMGKELRRHFL